MVSDNTDGQLPLALAGGPLNPAEQVVSEGERLNSLSEFTAALVPGFNPFNASPQPIARPDTLAEANAYTPITLNRILLSYSYMTQGLVQTVVEQPVDDALRSGFELHSDELSDDDLKLLMETMTEKPVDYNARRLTPLDRQSYLSGANLAQSDVEAIRAALVWARLYGGSGLVINTNQPVASPLDFDKIDDRAPLEFIAADRWELTLAAMNLGVAIPYNYYGLPLNRTRVIRILGKEAPSFIRQRLQGWGMSEIERCIRPINAFVKFETVVFELIDELKIDVFKITGFNNSLASAAGTEMAQKRVALANLMKNYQRSLTMDSQDDFTHKQISLSGIAEIYNELRLNLSCALKIPMNKLFGTSATGFGSGQDSIENYNSIVDGVRASARPVIHTVATLRSRQLFGFEPAIRVEFKPLKTLDGVQEEEVLNHRSNRLLTYKDRDLLSGDEFMNAIKKLGIYTGKSDVREGLREPQPGMGVGEFAASGEKPPTMKTDGDDNQEGDGK